MKTDGQSDLDTTLAANARSTGLNKDGNTLYAITSKPGDMDPARTCAALATSPQP